MDALRALNADIMVKTAAYGQILSREILSPRPHGVINAHGLILPRRRGASPVQCALLNGEPETGITGMKTEYEVDSGDIILIKKITLRGHENRAEVMDMLAKSRGRGELSRLWTA